MNNESSSLRLVLGFVRKHTAVTMLAIIATIITQNAGLL